MLQDLIIYTIGLLIVVRLFYKLYRFVFAKKGRINKCAGCSGCAMKKPMNKT
jgi:hypothetical protein